MAIRKPIKKIIDLIVLGIGKVEWKSDYDIGEVHKENIRQLLTKDYFIVLTRRNNHLSTFFTSLSTWIISGKWGFWSHALMNTEDEVKSDTDFRIVEAIGTGVTYSPFDKVFNVHHAVLLKPKNISLGEWTTALDEVRALIGLPYDTLFDMKTDTSFSCVELVYYALNKIPDARLKCPELYEMISRERTITPDMFMECKDFEVFYRAG